MYTRFQQSGFWCDFKCAHGWKKINHDKINVLVRSFRKGPVSFSLAYVPMAPEFKAESAVPGFEEQARSEVDYVKSLGDFAENVRSKLPKNTLCLRFDIPLDMPDVENRNEYLFRLPELCRISKVNLKKNES